MERGFFNVYVVCLMLRLILMENNRPRIEPGDVEKHFKMCIQWVPKNNIDSTKSIILREIQEEAIQKTLQVPTIQAEN